MLWVYGNCFYSFSAAIDFKIWRLWTSDSEVDSRAVRVRNKRVYCGVNRSYIYAVMEGFPLVIVTFSLCCGVWLGDPRTLLVLISVFFVPLSHKCIIITFYSSGVQLEPFTCTCKRRKRDGGIFQTTISVLKWGSSINMINKLSFRNYCIWTFYKSG